MANTFPALNNLDVPKFLVTTTAGDMYKDKKITEYGVEVTVQSLANSLPIALAYRGNLLNPQSTTTDKTVLEILEAYSQRAESHPHNAGRAESPPPQYPPDLADENEPQPRRHRTHAMICAQIAR